MSEQEKRMHKARIRQRALVHVKISYELAEHYERRLLTAAETRDCARQALFILGPTNDPMALTFLNDLQWWDRKINELARAYSDALERRDEYIAQYHRTENI